MDKVFLGFNLIGLIIAIFLITVGIYDLWLLKTKGHTISDKVQSWFPPAVDYIILALIIAGVWTFLGPNFATTITCGAILGHFFWCGR